MPKPTRICEMSLRLNCNIWYYLKKLDFKGIKYMVKYCKVWGWIYFWKDSFNFLHKKESRRK